MSDTPYAEHSTIVSYNKVSFIAVLGATAFTKFRQILVSYTLQLPCSVTR